MKISPAALLVITHVVTISCYSLYGLNHVAGLTTKDTCYKGSAQRGCGKNHVCWKKCDDFPGAPNGAWCGTRKDDGLAPNNFVCKDDADCEREDLSCARHFVNGEMTSVSIGTGHNDCGCMA